MINEKKTRCLGLDYGEKRVGLAVNDPLGSGAAPLAVVERRNDQQAVEAVARWMDEYEIAVCVVGLPLNMDGTEGDQARKTRSFVGRLRKARPDVEYVFHDERLTSFAADELMDERGIRGPERKRLRDQLSAMVVLEEFLQSRPIH